MQYHRYTKNEVNSITRESIRLFVGKQIDRFLEYLDDDFVFVADYGSLYLHGISEFVNYIKEERDLPPVKIEQEEYEVITHERHLWVSCGRYIVSFNAGGQNIVSKHHFTFMWKQCGNDLKLICGMACHVKDFPPTASSGVSASGTAQAKIFDEIPQDSASVVKQKLSVRDVGGKIRYLYADEIVYIQSDDKVCNVFTTTEAFSTRMTLSSFNLQNLIQIHKSYRVNKQYVREISRYRATLSDGVQIPIGKSRYMEIKKMF